jgi:steroid delta-isomerase-like uncharacterized protein
MLKSTCLIALAFVFLAIEGANAQSPTRKLINSWIDALNRHDLVALANMYSDSIQMESPNWDGTKVGKAEAIDVYRRYFTSTPDLKYEFVHLVESHSELVVEYISTGVLQNPEKNTPEYMRGKKYTLKNCTRMDLSDGKFTRQVNYFDQVAFLRQVGFFDQTH